MAVEAQVCPQCGAAVQFAAGQSEVVCGPCGTTVVRGTAPGGTTVEKELADEQLIQQTVAREKRLRGRGQAAAAKIVSAQPTDIFRPTVEGRAVLMGFALEVQPEGGPAFNAEAKALVGLAAVDKYRPGTLLNVRYDPQDHTQVAVEGRRGSDGNTVRTPEQKREERARKEKAKEQAQASAARSGPAGAPRADGTQAGATLARPWGGPPPGGGPAVEAPEGFEAVTGLGAAAAVHTHQGVRLLSNFGTPRANTLVRYHDGLAYRAHGAEVHTLRWDEIAAIASNVTVHTGAHTDLRETDHAYTLTKTNGEAVILDDGLQELGQLIRAVKQRVFERLAPPLKQRYLGDETLTFGPVTVQRQGGLQLDGKSYAWNSIQEIKLDDGRLKVTLRGGEKGQPGGQAQASAIPNIEILCQLIGVTFDAYNLGHWV